MIDRHSFSTQADTLSFLAALLLIIGFLGVSQAAPVEDDDIVAPLSGADNDPIPSPEVKVLFEEREAVENGYKFRYELSDGSAREETGTIVNPGTTDEYLTVEGFYRYEGPDKFTYRVSYKSGPGGYEAMTSRYKSRNRISPIALKSLVG
ncbi:hypothetical protein DMENIID0001_046000 [Sergentomyia squamirostris]